MREKTVIVYSKPACPQCTMTKKALTQRGVSFREEALDSEVIEKFAERGFRSAPIVVVGETAWAGFQPDMIDGLIAA